MTFFEQGISFRVQGISKSLQAIAARVQRFQIFDGRDVASSTVHEREIRIATVTICLLVNALSH
jgi:hypothetical protein